MVRQTEVAERVQRRSRGAGVGRRRADDGRGSETRDRGVVMVQTWVVDGQTMAKFRDERQRRGRGADVGHRRADDGRDWDPGQWHTEWERVLGQDGIGDVDRETMTETVELNRSLRRLKTLE